MQELSLVGLHDDGEHLVLAGPEGERFRVRVDEALRVAVRRDRPRLGQIQLQADGTLRPREIQARIRAGQTAEEVAEAAGVPVEHVRRYEGPVLAEREFVVRQARSVRLRRHGAPAGAAAPTLEEQVHQRLAVRQVDEQSADWDAWRAEDGTWVVTLAFTAAERRRRARWAYDVQLRHVNPLEDEARWLTDDEPPPQVIEGRRLAGALGSPGGERRGRREDVEGGGRDRVYDVDADGGVQVPDVPDGEAELSPAAAATVDLLDTLRERRGRRQRIALPDDDGPHRADGIPGGIDPNGRDVALEGLRTSEPRGIAAHPSRSRQAPPREPGVIVLPDADPVPVPEPGPSFAGHPSAGRGGRRAPAGASGRAGAAGATGAAGGAPGGGGGGTTGATRTAGRAATGAPPAAPLTPPPAPPSAPAAPAGTRAPATGEDRGAAGSSLERTPRESQQRRSRRQGIPAAAPSGTTPPPAPAGAGVPPPDLDTDLDADRHPSRRARRASVPSWDDIVFGARRE